MKKVIFLALCLVMALGSGHGVSAGVNDFKISRYNIDYRLTLDDERRSRLTTVETITAEFPAFDQNHGLEWAMPNSYDKHSVSLKVLSVANEKGETLKYSTNNINGNLVLRIGDADIYVHGSKTYVITYEQRDVTKYFSSTDDDEFYWDTNGVDWSVPIDNLQITLHVDDSLKNTLNGKIACYRGVEGSTDKCSIQKSGNDYVTQVTGLGPHENVSIAVGFSKGTFAAYEQTAMDRLWAIYPIIQGVLVAAAAAVVGFFGFLINRKNNRTKELGTIAPEYIPPKDTSVTVAAQVLPLSNRSTMTAQLLDLAVRHYIKIYETKQKSLFRAAEYQVEIIKDTQDLKWEEKELLSDMFASDPAVGKRLDLNTLKNNTSYYNRTLNNDSDLSKLIKGEYSLRQKDEVAIKNYRRIALVMFVASVLTLSIGFIVAAVIIFILSFMVQPLTDKGLALRRYLEGLKMYISVAEVERIKMLQSPDGVEKLGIVGQNDTGVLIKLYERVLPYAVLFGQEKEWIKQIGSYYEMNGSQPSWYSGSSGAFNVAAFSSGMTGFNTANSYTSSSSSSSGGSSGGGSSGGGGGGGGGGGW